MNLFNSITIGFKEIWAHKSRSLLTVLGIILGVASLVAMSALVKGMENGLRETMVAMGGADKVLLEEQEVPAYQEHLAEEAPGRTMADVMALRRSAFERVGPFDERFSTGGDEEDWLRRLRAAGGRVVYLADAGLDHRRAGDDARLRALMRSAYRRGHSLRAYDESRHAAPGLVRELRVLAGCGWHVVRRRCPQGLVMGAHSAGRLMQAVGR